MRLIKKLKIVLLTLILSTAIANAAGTLSADAGPDLNITVIPSNPSVTLDGSNSTSSSESIVSYEWFDATGSSLGTGATLNVIPPATGVYDVTLVVIDTDGNTSIDTVTVDVTVLTVDPVTTADAGADFTITVTPSNPSVTLDGSASTAGATSAGIVSYEWFDATGSSLGIGVSLDVIPPESRIYTVTLTVIDAEGNSASDTIVVTVVDGRILH